MRGQLDTAIGMILTLAIVAAVLALAVWGFFAISGIIGEGTYTRVFDSLETAAASHASYGSRHALRIAPPEPFCVFNASVPVSERVCAPGYSGHAICESSGLRSYWGNMSADDGNVVFRSNVDRRLDLIAPHNGAYACFRQGSQVVFMEGRGRYTTVSPLREIDSIWLANQSDAAITSVRVRLFTSSQRLDTPELLFIPDPRADAVLYAGSRAFEGESVAISGTGVGGELPDVTVSSVYDIETPQFD